MSARKQFVLKFYTDTLKGISLHGFELQILFKNI